MSDPWAQMDVWCKRQSDDLCVVAERMLVASDYNTETPEYRVVLGQSQAFARMRSFIHGARNCDSGGLPEGEDTGTVAECEASQSGRSDSEGIAQPTEEPTP